MDDEIKVVLVKYAPNAKKAYMFECSTDTYFENGDTVIVLNANGEETEATVVDSVTYNFKYKSDLQELNRLLMVAGTEMPFRKVVGKIKRTYFDYKDEKTDEEETTDEE